MRALFLGLLLCLAGCNSIMRPGSDVFEASGVAPDQFENDDSACRQQADDYLAYDVRGQDLGTRYQKNRTFNLIYGRCMTARGYRHRAYLKNLLPG
jgi:hypothetical protein